MNNADIVMYDLLLRGVWIGENFIVWNYIPDIAILLLWFLAGMVVTIKMFRID